MNFNLLENIHGCIVVLCGQNLLHKGIIAISLEDFHSYWLIPDNHEISHLKHFTTYDNC